MDYGYSEWLANLSPDEIVEKIDSHNGDMELYQIYLEELSE